MDATKCEDFGLRGCLTTHIKAKAKAALTAKTTKYNVCKQRIVNRDDEVEIYCW